jgi:hypothetical protein
MVDLYMRATIKKPVAAASGSVHTVNKLRSINLLFSCMCRIERKIVTLNWKILALLLLMRKNTQLQKNGKK